MHSHLQHPFFFPRLPHTKALLDHSTCLLTSSVLLAPACFHSGTSLSACSLKAEGTIPVPYWQPLQIHPDWVRAQPPGHSWLSLPLHPGAAGMGTVGCCLTNPPQMQLSNLISHISEGLNCLHFYSRCTNLME